MTAPGMGTTFLYIGTQTDDMSGQYITRGNDMKIKKKYDHGRIELRHKEKMLKVSVFSEYGAKTPVAEFYVPKQDHHFVPREIIDFRLKRDFGIQIGHCSYCHMAD